MRVLIVGYGSIGKRHARNLLSLGVDVFAYDTDPNAFSFSSPVVPLHTMEWEKFAFDGVLICTPAGSHVYYLGLALNLKVPIFVEKPLAQDTTGLTVVLEKAKADGIPICVGYNLRFHPGLKLVKELLGRGSIGYPLLAHAQFSQYLPDWRPEQDYKQSYTAKLGIILDASHEIDYLCWLLGSVKRVACFTAKYLDMEAEDTAALLLEFQQGSFATVQVDMVQQGNYVRNCQITGNQGTLTWDYKIGQEVGKFISNKVVLNEVPRFDNSQRYWEENMMYLEEMLHFVAVIQGEQRPIVSAEEGLEVLRVALAAKRSAASGYITPVMR